MNRWLQIGLGGIVLVLLVGHAMSVGLSHDENKFVYAGQALADYGQLPYRDYPYDQMPYAALFYALPTKLSTYNFLVDRLFGSVVWLSSIVALLAIIRLIGPEGPMASWATQAAVVLVFLLDPVSAYVLAAVKNNSFATLFALLAFLFYVRGVKGVTRAPAAAFWAGLFASVAGCTRLNYFVVLFVLVAMWALYAIRSRREALKLTGLCMAGAIAGTLPLLALVAAAPMQSYYANIVQLRLTTLYYQDVLWRINMDLPGKLRTFVQGSLYSPIQIILYALLATGTLASAWRFFRREESTDLIVLASAGCAGGLLLTAFMATPMEGHYLFAPLPFLLLVTAVAVAMLPEHAHWARGALLVAVVVTLAMRSTVVTTFRNAGRLLYPETWFPVRFHQAAQELLNAHDIQAGKVLSLLPMMAAEGGHEGYRFTASGSNSWRTSQLLTADRRRLYGVTSPEELEAVLDASPPVAIVTGFEMDNPGFTFRDLGGLEQPFMEYARAHGYRPVAVQTAVYGQELTLWER